MRKIKFLESIRGIGALMVVFFHFIEVFFPGILTGDPSQYHLSGSLEWLIYSSPLRLLVNGPAAVAVFFVLSGYVLTFKFFSTKDSQVLQSGGFRRYFRLLPVVLVVELIAYLCLRFGLYVHASQLPAITLTHTWIDAYATPALLGKVLYEAFFGVFVAHKNQYVVPLWTMTYEFLGAMLVFVTAYIGSRLPKGRTLFFAAVAALFLNTYYIAFVLGMILADLSQRPDQPIKRYLRPATTAILGIVGLFLLSFPAYTDFADYSIYRFMHFHSIETKLVIYYYTWGAFLVLLSVLNSSKLQEMLSARPLVYLGRISFPLYAIHWIVLGSLSSALFIWTLPAAGYYGAFLLTMGISLPVIFLLSELLKRWVDDPGIRTANLLYKTARKLVPQGVFEKSSKTVQVPARITEDRGKSRS